jgi:hypothetical protein
MKKIFLLLAITVFAISSCKKDFGDLNVDTKKPTAVPAGSLFGYAAKALSDEMASSNVNRNIFRLITQQWTETTYTDETNYDLITRNIPQNFWNDMFLSVLKNLKESQALVPGQNIAYVPAAVQKNENASIEILNVYTYAVLTNLYGDIPYSQALNSDNVHPSYDNSAAIYKDLLTRLDKAIGDIDVTQGGFGASDLLLGDDMAGWKAFGNSLKLRLGMMLADVDPATAKTTVESAAAGAITDNSGNVAFKYLSAPPNTNPIWVDLVQSGRKDFVAANTLIQLLDSIGDPRVPYYFTVDATGGYTGGSIGDGNNYSTFSKPSATITSPSFENLLFDAAETQFLLAEAVERGWNVGAGTAADHYALGIRASISYWGGSTADADAYLLKPNIAYATAHGTWKEKIGVQKWIALYNRGFDAYTEWRRLDYPILPLPTQSLYPTTPVRFTYPVQEQNLNTDSYNRAATAIGGDKTDTKLFWDKF